MDFWSISFFHSVYSWTVYQGWYMNQWYIYIMNLIVYKLPKWFEQTNYLVYYWSPNVVVNLIGFLVISALGSLQINFDLIRWWHIRFFFLTQNRCYGHSRASLAVHGSINRSNRNRCWFIYFTDHYIFHTNFVRLLYQRIKCCGFLYLSSKRDKSSW